MKINRVMLADSYKYSQPMQYPTDIVGMYDYMEARKGIYDGVVFFGLQFILKEYLSDPITMDEVDEAKAYADAHGEPFDYDGWVYIVNDLGGRLPVEIKAIPEGTFVPNRVPLATINYTDERVYWVVGFLETLLMKVWYPTTVATKSYLVRKMLERYAEQYSDSKDGVPFMYHNFGDRGSTTVEAASIGGIAHLASGLMGTDNFHALKFAKEYYNEDIAGFSIAASEHSTVTSWGKDCEFDMYNHYIETFKDKPIIACVLDSYDIFEATRRITSGEFKEKIESDDYPIFVMRPDSGDAVQVVSQMLDICLENDVAFDVNSKKLRVMKKYRIIYGDGISPEVIEQILNVGIAKGFAPDNFAFGSGGDLMQKVNRDTCGFAVKCSSVDLADGTSRDVFKDPITDPGKKSKKGKVTTFYDSETGEYIVGTIDGCPTEGCREVLETVYLNGEITKEYTFAEVRANTDK